MGPTGLPAGAPARVARWLPALAWMGLISYWSGQSELPIDHPRVARMLLGMQHPLAHAAAFGVLALLLRGALAGRRGGGLWAWGIAAAFGALDEWHQSFTPRRAVELSDWLVDAGAAAAAVALAGAVAGRPRALSPARLALGACLVAALAVGTVALARPAQEAGPAFVGRVARVVERAVPDQVEARAASLGRRVADVARAAHAEWRAWRGG